MKQFSRVLFVAAAIAAVPGAAMAGGRVGQSPECKAAHDAPLLPTYDTNKDGALDRSERQALRQDRRKQALGRYDADRDGRLNEAEWVKMRRDRVAERFARLDVNRDGAITRAEASAPCSHLASHFDAVDTDRDGRVTVAEMGAAASKFGRHGKGRFHHHGAGSPQQEDDQVGPEAAPAQE